MNLTLMPGDRPILLAALRARTDQLVCAQANARRREDMTLYSILVEERDRIEELMWMMRAL